MLWHKDGAASRGTMEALGSASCNDVTAALPDERPHC